MIDDINDFFVNNMETLKTIAYSISFKHKRGVKPDAAINECYLYIYKIRDKIKNKEDIKRFSIKYLREALGYWPSSSKYKLNPLLEGEGYKWKNYTLPDVADCSIDIENKENIERWYLEKKNILKLYREQESNKIYQIIYDCYFIKNITKVMDMSRHLNINKDYTAKYIREMKKSIYQFYLKNKENNG